MCGGTLTPAGYTPSVKGLSPRVRGNRILPGAGGGGFGSIPACAGEPPSPARRSPTTKVYPRVCGGTSLASWVVSSGWGLSPRVRGNPRHPARPLHRTGVYPRVCGGTTPAIVATPRAVGLSPRVRGNLPQLRQLAGGKGSIPACAGEPTTNSVMPPPPAVYPRVCGGTPSIPSQGAVQPGLSPRVRGNRLPPVHRATPTRSIPACAGEPIRAHRGHIRRRVYPRVCGGTHRRPRQPLGRPGLSPRVRGNRLTQAMAYLAVGSIPACAGEPRPGRPGRPCRPVYPRVCGGTRVRRL